MWAAASTGIIGRNFGREGLVERETVIVSELFASGDRAQGIDIDVSADFAGLAIGFTGMVDPAGGVAMVTSINNRAILKEKVEGMVGVGRIMGMTAVGLPGADACALVFDDAFASGDSTQGKNAFAVNTGTPHLNAPDMMLSENTLFLRVFGC